MKRSKILSLVINPYLLAIVLYLLIYLVRSQQPGWNIELDLFPQMRESLDQKITENLPSPQAELLSGILLGNKKDLPGDLRLALRDTSTLHIVVVSGQNLTLLAALFLSLAGILKRKVAIFISIGAVIFYTILTGGQIPVIRAAIMAVLSFMAQIYGKDRDGIWVLMLTGGGMLLINPAWATELSFQLSFLATLGVITVAPVIQNRLKFLPDFIKQDLAVTVGAQLMVIPIIAQYFHQLSIVGVFANLLVGWTIPFIMILGTLMILVGPIFAIFTNIMLTYFIYVIYFFSSLPFAWEYVGEKLWIVWVGYYMILAAGLLSLKNAQTENSRESEKDSRGDGLFSN